jgi:hypothetical protein
MMPTFVNKSFVVTSNPNRRYEVINQNGIKIASYNPLTQQIHFNAIDNPSFSLDKLKEMQLEDRKKLRLSEEAVQTIYFLIKDLPVLANRPRMDESDKSVIDVSLNTSQLMAPDPTPAIEMEDTVGKNIERPLFIDNGKTPKLINDTYTEPEICNNYDNIKGKNNLFILFNYKVNGILKPIKIPGNEVNLIPDLGLRVLRMKELCSEIALKLSGGWNPTEKTL